MAQTEKTTRYMNAIRFPNNKNITYVIVDIESRTLVGMPTGCQYGTGGNEIVVSYSDDLIDLFKEFGNPFNYQIVDADLRDFLIERGVLSEKYAVPLIENAGRYEKLCALWIKGTSSDGKTNDVVMKFIDEEVNDIIQEL